MVQRLPIAPLEGCTRLGRGKSQGGRIMRIEKRFANLSFWLIAVSILLAIITSCSPYVSTPTPTPTQAATATRQLSQVAIIEPTPTPRACIVSTGIDAGKLNLRAGASVAYSVIQTLREGQRLNITDAPAQGNWIQIKTLAGVIGWLNAKYCKGV